MKEYLVPSVLSFYLRERFSIDIDYFRLIPYSEIIQQYYQRKIKEFSSRSTKYTKER